MRVDLLPEDGVIQSVDNVNNGPPPGTTSLVQNPGANPNILIKNLKEGSNITITDNGTDLQIAASSSVPNSDFANLGAGNAILATTGVLPVTSTRNFKSLLAGTNITMTPAANTLTVAASNLYTSDGTLTGNRTVTHNSNSYTHTGIGTINLQPTGVVTIGTLNQKTQINGNFFLNNLLGLGGNTFLVIDALKQVGTTTGTLDKAIFAVGMTNNPPIVIPGPYVVSTFPSSFGFKFATNYPQNHVGYNNAGVLLNLVTGVYSPSAQINVSIFMRIDLKNNTEIPNFTLTLYNVTTGTIRSSHIVNYGVINQYNTYEFHDCTTLSAVNDYVFRILINNGAGTTTTIADTLFSINLF